MTRLCSGFDHVLSLGQACDATFQIRRVFGQDASYPFDWLITPYLALYTTISEDFSEFMPEQHLTGEHHYVLDTRTQIMFLHDFKDVINFRMDLPNVRAKYIRRVRRWLTKVRTASRILFVRSQQYVDQDNIDEKDARSLLRLLQAKYTSVDIHLMILNPGEAGIDELYERNLSIHKVVPPEPFVWSGNNDSWDRAFTKAMSAASSSRVGQETIEKSCVEVRGRPMVNVKRVFDCFIFYNEVELLRLRLEELYNKVDFFVICESTITFQGEPKPLFYSLNKEQFAKFAPKIIHVVVDDLPAKHTDSAANEGAESETFFWNREHFQRNALRRGLTVARPDDIIIVSDCDEIIRPEAIDFMRLNSGYFALDMAMYQFFFNMRAQVSGWRKSFAYSYFLDSEMPDYNLNRTNALPFYENFSKEKHYIENAGWHFTFLGGITAVADKLKAYSHASGWQRRMWDKDALEDQMLALREVGGGNILKFCQVDETFPRTLQDNVAYYLERGLIKDRDDRLKELEMLWERSNLRYREVVEAHEQALRELSSIKHRLEAEGFPIAKLINLISSSSDFSSGWNNGSQSTHPRPSEHLPLFESNNVVMQHFRDGAFRTPDPNIGYFRGIPVKPGFVYTASCYVWLPEESPGGSADLSLDSWPNQIKTIARVEKRGCWQRIWTTGPAPDSAFGCNVVLRTYGTVAFSMYSTCWQFEEGELPTTYKSTRVGSSNQ